MAGGLWGYEVDWFPQVVQTAWPPSYRDEEQRARKILDLGRRVGP